MTTPTIHATDVYPVTRFGARRYESRCRECDWKGELRPDARDAESDGTLHEATTDPRQTSIEGAA
jgi:hypothetical protein